MQLVDLPSELIEAIIDFSDMATLKMARLVCPAWTGFATRSLFHTIALTPTREGLQKWHHIVNSDLSHSVRQAVINSCPVPDYAPNNYTSKTYKLVSRWRPDAEDEKYAGFYSAVKNLSRLPNIDHACLRFTENCAAEADYHAYEGFESVAYRLDLLRRTFQALYDRRNGTDSTPVKALTIYNLQNMPLPEFTSSELFSSVMQDVQHLHLHICEEYNDGGPGDDVYCEERRTFMPYLQDHWLAAVASRLRSLTLYFVDCWGPLPGHFSGSGLSFPSLETLTLGQCCLAHHDAFDWVLAQKSLKSLRLYNCMIASHLRLWDGNVTDWQVRTHDWIKYPKGVFGLDMDDNSVYHYPGTWKTVFDRIRSELPQLSEFRFNFGRCHEQESAFFNGLDRFPTELAPVRYVVFDMGVLPSQWVDADDRTGEMAFSDSVDDADGFNRHKETEKEDSEALEALTSKLLSRKRSHL
ncbi:hypothetical protein OHC33_006363 [Knufia fluminis]|uniref:F-box domain-containing protein n=1 Tax=Knufia fluminis TaxID=191047 RepID=A0AAN8ENX3_9EURO|nr:hypothetical protein OHC33_006363 [Knufia fluminis]